MKILTVENETYDLDEIPETIDDLRYGILDYTNPSNVDYYFIPLVFLESFYAPAAILQIGQTTISMPLDWHMVICDAEVGDPEVMSLMSLNDRGFTAFAFNPITGFSAQYIDVSIVNIYRVTSSNGILAKFLLFASTIMSKSLRKVPAHSLTAVFHIRSLCALSFAFL